MSIECPTTKSEQDLDTLRTPADAAKWIGFTEEALLANARRGRIPAVRINARVIRFHLPTVLAALQKGGPRG
jgi:hypothetical protein